MRNWWLKEVNISLLVNFPFLVHPRNWQIPGSYRYVGTDTCGRKKTLKCDLGKMSTKIKRKLARMIYDKNINIEKNEKKRNKMGGVKV